MKVIAVINSYPGSGQTTVAVNLATGLQARGRRVLMVDLGGNDKLREWLGVMPPPEGAWAGDGLVIAPSRLGVDLLSLDADAGGQPAVDALTALLQTGSYDYVLIHPATRGHLQPLIGMGVRLALCTDLEEADQLGRLQALQRDLAGAGAEPSPIDLIIANKINTKEWDHNSRQLFALGDHFGYEVLADPIPHCERIHDLPLTGKTVWELQQENLKSAFGRLVETVEGL